MIASTTRQLDAVDPHAVALIGAVVSLLTIASLIGYALKRGFARRAPHNAIDNLNARIKAWWVIAAVFGLALLLGRSGVTVLFALVSYLALREFTQNSARPNASPMERIGFIFLLPAQYVLVWLEWNAPFIVCIPACLLFAWMLLAKRVNSNDRDRQVVCGVILCVYLLSYAPALLNLRVPGYGERGAYLLVFLALVTQLGDVLQYIWGKLLGRHKIAPAISPGKTVEGTVGGIVSATLLGAGLAVITPFGIAQAAVIALALALLGFLGGLVFSAIKRRRGIKDWDA